MSKLLTENFTEDRQDALKKKLVTARSFSDLADILHRELAFYADIEGDYINSLTPSQAKVALALLAILRESHDTLGDTTVAFKNSYPQNKSFSKTGSQSDTIATTIGAGLGAFLGVLESPIAAIIGAAIGSSAAKMIYDSIQEKSVSTKKTQHFNPINLQFNTDILLSKIVNLFKRIDKLVIGKELIIQSITEKNTPELDEEYKDILEFLQELMGEAIVEDSNLLTPQMQKLIKGRIPTLLMHHNIEILIYPTNTKHLDNIDDYFDFEQSLELDFHESVTLKPALVKNKNIVLKGLVREHNNQS
ncbi:hypothetical protein [Nostoc sp.]|uniref:hypothetical protein n=1 Tax=Nostoc sp. TaxID=1180 RepID=UPI002FEFD5C5